MYVYVSSFLVSTELGKERRSKSKNRSHVFPVRLCDKRNCCLWASSLCSFTELVDSLRTSYVKYPWKGRCFNVKMAKKRIDQVFTLRSKTPTVDFLYSSSLFPSFSLSFSTARRNFNSCTSIDDDRDKLG